LSQNLEDYSILAHGSLQDTAGNCLHDSVVGTFYNGVVAGSDTAYVEVAVRVDSTGDYTISSDKQKWFFIFSDKGSFTSTGINIIKLKAVGKATLPGITNFTISFDSSVCYFSVNVKDSTGTGLGGSDTTGTGGSDTTGISGENKWSYLASGYTYAGTIDSASFDNTNGLVTYIYLHGITASGDTSLLLNFVEPTSTVTTGTYTVNQGVFFAIASTTEVLFEADALTPNTSDFKVTITSYNAATKKVTGTFDGPVHVNGGLLSPTNGTFSAVFK